MQFRANNPGDEFAAQMQTATQAIAHAATAAMHGVVADAVKAAKADLASSGFGAKWQDSIHARFFPQSGDSLQTVGEVYSTLPFLAVFENGATIHGKPTLWLPIEANLPVSSQRLTPKLYNRTIGRLVLVARPGYRPLLYDPHRKKFVFVGVPQVTIGKHLHVTEAVTAAVEQFDKAYDLNFKVD